MATKVIKSALLIAAAFALVCLGLFLLQLRKTATELEAVAAELHQTAIATTSLVQEAHGRLVGTSQNLNAILIQIGLASDEVRRASIEQRDYFNQIGARTVKTLDKTDDAIASVNTVATDFDHQINRIGDSTVETMADFNAQIGKLPIQDLKALIDNPDIPETLDAMKGAAVETHGTMKDVHHVTTYVDHEITAPKRWYQKAIGWLGTGASVAVKFLPPL